MNRVATVLVAALLAGILLAIGIPLVLRWREQAERVRCQDHLRRIGALALCDIAEKTRAFPAGTVVVNGVPPERRLSWVVSVLPYLGRGQIGKDFDLMAAWDSDVNRPLSSTPIAALLCPGLVSAPTAGVLHYPGIPGVGPDAPILPRANPRAGIMRYNEPTPVAAVTDGLSTVLLLVETGQGVGPWGAGGPGSVRGFDPEATPYVGEGRPFGGAHRGGANMAMADGSVRFFTEAVSPSVLEMLAAMADGTAQPALLD